MDVFRLSERLMTMDDDSWARHANPYSVLSRFTCLPLIVAAIASRQWLGWWCLGPLALAAAWTWLNPRLFSPPKTFDSWAAKGVLGERLFLDRANKPIANHHKGMAYLLTAASAVGVCILAYGLAVLAPWPILCGLIVAMGAKIWFVDRMVWIYHDAE
jgi:hypothetical protein